MRKDYKYIGVNFGDHPQVNRFGSLPFGAGWVYAIRLGDKVKLGKTKNPDARLSALQSQQGGPYDEAHFIVCDNKHDGERGLHYAFKAYRLQGEWFRLSHLQTEVIRTIREFKNGKFN